MEVYIVTGAMFVLGVFRHLNDARLFAATVWSDATLEDTPGSPATESVVSIIEHGDCVADISKWTVK